MAGKKDEFETVFDLVDAVFDGDAGHGLSFTTQEMRRHRRGRFNNAKPERPLTCGSISSDFWN
ncbi:hypothetical protein EME01_36320 [Sinorhizobium meliloti]|nr:hypothetical protein EME01_36320 [Sinorhizobium meliloti]